MLWLPKRKIIKLKENNVEVKIANWTFKIGEIAELKNANGLSLAWIAQLKKAKKHFWV